MAGPAGLTRGKLKPHELQTEEGLVAKIEEIRKAIRAATKDSSHTAISALSRLELDALKWLYEIREESQSTVSWSDPELAETLVASVPELDEVTFRRLAAAVDQRRGGHREAAGR